MVGDQTDKKELSAKEKKELELKQRAELEEKLSDMSAIDLIPWYDNLEEESNDTVLSKIND